MLLKRSSHSIELWGEPGVGKTTLANKLVKEFGYKKFSSTEKQHSKAYLCLRYPLVTLFWFWVIFQNYLATKKLDIARYNLALLFSSLRKIQFINNVSNTSVVVDEGFVQRLLSYSDIVFSKKQIEKIISHSPTADVIVWVNDREVTQERYTALHQRSLPGELYLKQWKRNQKINIQTIADVLGCSDKALFFETKNTSLEQIMSELYDFKK